VRATVEFKLPNGELRALGHGDLIGRLWSAELQLNDGRVSEAHAMVSNRGRDLRLLALRGRFAVNGKTLSNLILRPGQIIAFASDLQLEVTRVEVPEAVLALQAPRVAKQILNGVTSIYGGARPRLVSGWDSEASDVVWPTGDGWMRGRDNPSALLPGDTWEVNGVAFRAVEERTQGARPTAHELGFTKPLRLVARFDSVHLMRDEEPVLVISGQSARVISELVTMACPVEWETLAVQLWGDRPRDVLRRRWDMQTLRLRKKLRESSIREDLVRSDGSGLIELVLGPDDSVVDET